jgi:hypothetical protein
MHKELTMPAFVVPFSFLYRLENVLTTVFSNAIYYSSELNYPVVSEMKDSISNVIGEGEVFSLLSPFQIAKFGDEIANQPIAYLVTYWRIFYRNGGQSGPMAAEICNVFLERDTPIDDVSFLKYQEFLRNDDISTYELCIIGMVPIKK